MDGIPSPLEGNLDIFDVVEIHLVHCVANNMPGGRPSIVNSNNNYNKPRIHRHELHHSILHNKT